MRFGLQPLRLRDGAGKRGSQLMRGVGGKASFGIEGGLQPFQKLVQGVCQRSDLGREFGCGSGDRSRAFRA